MRLPKQTSSVDRDLNANASVAGQVAPSSLFGTIAKFAAPILTSLI